MVGVMKRIIVVLAFVEVLVLNIRCRRGIMGLRSARFSIYVD